VAPLGGIAFFSDRDGNHGLSHRFLF
jgi:hypothetical protein